MTDVLLLSMPFGPLFSPSLGLSLLQPQVRAGGLTCRIEYLTLPFADHIGQALYSKIASESRAISRAFAGEWIFSNALFEWSSEQEQRYLSDVLTANTSWGRNPTRPPSAADVRLILAARSLAPRFLDECADRISEAAPRLIGFTSVFQQHLASLALAKRIKARLPRTLIVFGGANCEGPMGVETLRQFPFVDAIVSGEGDRVFPELARRLLDGEPVDGLQGVVTQHIARGGLPASQAPTVPPVNDLDALPYPEYADFFEQFERTRFARTWQPSVFVETSRGCWWGERMHCTFCGLNGATMAYRSKSAPRALAELTYLSEAFPGCDIQMVDNILDLKYFKTLLPALAERRLNVSLFYETKSNLKKEQVRLLRDAGVTTIQPGIESFSDEVLKLMKKGVSGLQNIQLLKWCKEFGVEPLWNFLLGFPGESPDDYQRMADLAARVCHLPRPLGVSAIRLDRFSPNFNQSEQLGFTDVRPLAFYEFLYDVPEDARRNLAYYFAYDYQQTQDVAQYAEPLVRAVRAWTTTWQHAELLSVDLDNQLIVFDTRPRARAPLSVLTGADRDLYLRCDAIAESGELPESSVSRLGAMVERGLMLNEGTKYLALAVPLGEYRPSLRATTRLRALFARLGKADRRGVTIVLDRPEYRIDQPAFPHGSLRPRGPLKPARAGLEKSDFELTDRHHLYVRGRVRQPKGG